MTVDVAPECRAAGTEAGGFGGFLIGDIALALPMTALREVVPCTALTSLPCVARCVIGAIDLRGVLVPVVDLRIVLGRPAHDNLAGAAVIVMVHERRIVGLLADGVTGIFHGVRGTHNPAGGVDGAGLFCASVRRDDDDSLIAVLSPVAVATLEGVVLVDDPEPARQTLDGESAVVDDVGAPTVPMMLMHCGGAPLAIDAMAVHATLASPAVRPSALAFGACRGVIDYENVEIAAVDLRVLCRLGAATREASSQAFVMALPEGRVAFLVDGVIDVVRTRSDDVVPVPRFALPESTLFAGALPAAKLPAELADRPGASATQYLVIDAAALAATSEVRTLATTNIVSGAATTDGAASEPGAMATTVVTFWLGEEQATPIDDLTEILPYRPDAAGIAKDGAFLGFLFDRGRSIPVIDLGRIVGGTRTGISAGGRVLVVESDDEWIGFAVPELRTIETATWGAGIPRYLLSRAAARDETQEVAMVGHGDGDGGARLLPLVRLRDLARNIRESGTRLH